MVTAFVISLAFNLAFAIIIVLAVIAWKEDKKNQFHFKAKKN